METWNRHPLVVANSAIIDNMDIRDDLILYTRSLYLY